MIDKDGAIIVEGCGKPGEITSRVKALRAQIEASSRTMTARNSRSSPRAGRRRRVIKVGAATKTEMKEKKARIEDALYPTRAALEEGIVPDGWRSCARPGRWRNPASKDGEGAAYDQIGA